MNSLFVFSRALHTYNLQFYTNTLQIAYRGYANTPILIINKIAIAILSGKNSMTNGIAENSVAKEDRTRTFSEYYAELKEDAKIRYVEKFELH